MSKPIHKEIDIKAAPQRVYQALLDAKQFGAISGAPAEIEGKPGGAFSCFGGIITGRNIELEANRRIVQAWRVKMWPDGVYSVVTFDLKPEGSGTRLSVEHKAFPEELRPHLNGDLPEGGWDRQYLHPLRKHFE